MSTTSNLSAPVYVPVHKRIPSSSTRSSTALTYTRDELLSMAPSTSTSFSPSSSPVDASPLSTHVEHTYSHPQPHQGWLELNTAMRRYLRLSCPEIVMNRKMRKTVEYQHFQHRAAAHAKSPTRNEHQRSASRESARSEKSPSGNARPSSPLSQSVTAPQEEELAAAPVQAVPAPTPSPAAATTALISRKRPTPRRTPSGRTPRAPRATGTRARYSSALFHRQRGDASSEASWRKAVDVTAVAPRAQTAAVASH